MARQTRIAEMRSAVEPTTTAAELTHGPVVGAMTANSASVFGRTGRPAALAVQYSRAADLSNAATTEAAQTGDKGDLTGQVVLSGLEPNTTYYMNVLVNDVPQLKLPYPTFKTFPTNGSVADFSFVMLTDASVTSPREVKTFVSAGAEEPDFVILGGDFPHGRPITLEQKRWNFKAIYSPKTSPSMHDFVYSILRRYPVAHIWDDHDYGPDNGDKTYGLKELSLQVLREYFPTYPLSKHGDWQKFSYGQADFFLLDSRSQRDPVTTASPIKSMLDGDQLGADGQLAWLEEGLKHSTAVWKFIVSPVPFNPTSKPPDSWAAYPAERNALIEFIQKNKITGVVVISGDLHMGGIDNGTNSTFPEMTVNGANGPGCQSNKTPGIWSEGSYNAPKGACNGYGVITVLTNPDRVLLEIKDANGGVRVSYTVHAP